MSERGSFITEYVYCGACALVAAKFFSAYGRHKYWCTQQLDSWIDGERLPVFAGKLGGMYSGAELHDFEDGWGPELQAVICHPMRIAVLADGGERIYRLRPGEKKVESICVDSVHSAQ